MAGVSAGAFIPGVSGLKDNPSGLFSSLWTQASSYSGYSAYFSDVGVGGSIWLSDGVKWRPYGGRVTLKNLTTSISNNAAPKIVMDFATIPAGLIQDGDIIEIEIDKDRLGGVADTDATDVLIGTVSTTLGTSLTLTTSALATTSIQLSLRYRFRKESSTSIRPISITGSVGLGVNTIGTAAVTVPNMDSQTTYIQVSSDLTTAAGEVVWLRGYTVTLICGS